MSIFQTTYAVQRPVTTSVATSRSRRFWRLDSVGIGRAEAYALGRSRRPLESLVAACADREHRAGALGAAVDPSPRDTGRRLRPPETVGLTVAREEADAGAAGTVLRPQPFRRDLLAERGCDREPVQVDSERRLAQLRLVAAADPRRQLEHERSVAADPDLRDGRAFADGQSLGGPRGEG